MASDDLSSSCAFALPGFAPHSWCTLDTVLIPSIWTSVEVESWPPRVGQRITKVLSFERGVATMNGGDGKGGASAKGGSGPLTVAVVGSKKKLHTYT